MSLGRCKSNRSLAPWRGRPAGGQRARVQLFARAAATRRRLDAGAPGSLVAKPAGSGKRFDDVSHRRRSCATKANHCLSEYAPGTTANWKIVKWPQVVSARSASSQSIEQTSTCVAYPRICTRYPPHLAIQIRGRLNMPGSKCKHPRYGICRPATND